MLMLHLGLGIVALLVFLIARTQLPRQILATDSVFAGLIFFFVGSWVTASSMIDSPQAATVLELSTACLFSAALASCFLSPLYRGLPPVLADPQPLRADFVLATSILLVTSNLFFSLLVFRVLLGGSMGILADENALLAIRKLIATGEQGYFFPGLVKQLRDVLAPAFIFYLIAYSRPRENRLALFAVVGTTILAIFFGGQRMPFLVLIWAIFLGRRLRSTTLSTRQVARLSIPRLAAYAALSIVVIAAINQMLGRVAIGGTALQAVAAVPYGIYERVVLTVPQANIDAFNFILNRDFGIGQLWLSDLARLVPGTQVGISNEIHSYLGGSFAGNAVLGLPVSAYLNAGYPGVLIVPFILILFVALLDRRVARLNSPLVTSVRCVILVYLPMCYDPAIFLQSGGVMLFCVLAWVIFFTPRRRRELVIA
jgi:hypothetical protein